MGIVCCALSKLVSHFMNYGERFATCYAYACMITCMVTIIFSLGIGLGYTYCFTDLKTRNRYLPALNRHAPEYGHNLYTFGHVEVPTTRTPTFSTPKYGYPGEMRVTKYPGEKGWYQNTLFHRKSTPWWKAVRFTDLPPHIQPKPRRVEDIQYNKTTQQNNDNIDFDFKAKSVNITNNHTSPINDTVTIKTTTGTDYDELDDIHVIISDKTEKINTTSGNKSSILKFITPGKMLKTD